MHLHIHAFQVPRSALRHSWLVTGTAGLLSGVLLTLSLGLGLGLIEVHVHQAHPAATTIRQPVSAPPGKDLMVPTVNLGSTNTAHPSTTGTALPAMSAVPTSIGAPPGKDLVIPSINLDGSTSNPPASCPSIYPSLCGGS